MYVQYNRCRPDPTLPMERFAAQVFAAADSLGAERLVIDMRLNGGGDSRVLQPFVNRLWRHRLNAPGRLFVAIGRQTFSSGMMNAAQLDRSTHATLVGEPTGGRPNHFGEVRSFRLPNSGATVYHSTRRFEMLPGRDAPSLEPEVRVPVTWADYAAGRDPVLDVILAMPLPESR